MGTQRNPLVPTDGERALDEAMENLKEACREVGATVTHDPLPPVPADPSQLVRLFQNLIANGIKFHGDRAPAVHVGVRRTGEDWEFSVRDNGIGIDPKHKDRILRIFQRLHGRSAYPGTGIGLATCKKIVERHGGRIWVESEPGRGSVFYFTLPALKEPVSPGEATGRK